MIRQGELYDRIFLVYVTEVVPTYQTREIRTTLQVGLVSRHGKKMSGEVGVGPLRAGKWFLTPFLVSVARAG